MIIAEYLESDEAEEMIVNYAKRTKDLKRTPSEKHWKKFTT
jgi:hypothetical protein